MTLHQKHTQSSCRDCRSHGKSRRHLILSPPRSHLKLSTTMEPTTSQQQLTSRRHSSENDSDNKSPLCNDCKLILRQLPRAEYHKPFFHSLKERIEVQAANGCSLCKLMITGYNDHLPNYEFTFYRTSLSNSRFGFELSGRSGSVPFWFMLSTEFANLDCHEGKAS